MNKNKLFNLGISTIFHFFMDYFPITIFYTYFENLPNLFYIILVYNLLAFSLEPFLGYLCDRFSKFLNLFKVSSLLLLGLGYALSFFNVYLCLIFLGVGNSLFHTSFSKQILSDSKKKYPLGIFISSGVLGLGIGYTFLNEYLIFCMFLTYLIFVCLYLNMLFRKKCSINYIVTEFREYKPFTFNRKYIVILVSLVVISIFFRGSFSKLLPSYNYRYSFLIISISAFVAKFIGGFFNNKIILISSIVISIISSIFKDNFISGIFITFSVNLLMPLTLDYLRKIFYKKEATSLGLSAFFLLIPNLLLIVIPNSSFNNLYIVFMIIHLVFLVLFTFFEFSKLNENN